MSDCLIKLSRASRHMEDLQTKITDWLEGDNYRVWTEKDPNRADYFSVRVSAKPIPLEPFATLIGDALHNMRGSLDHMAYALALEHSVPLPDDVAELSEFPIFGDKNRSGKTGVGPQMFRDNGLVKIGAVHPSAQTIIERLQPYHRGNDFSSHPLWKLRELSNIDKHRLLVSAFFHARSMHFRVIDLKDTKIGPMEARDCFIDGETEVGWYKATQSIPIIGVDMKALLKPDLAIVFRYGGTMDGKVVLETLAEIHRYILQDVAIPLAPFM